MATELPPKKNTAYTTEVCLVSQADTNTFQTSVTLAAGDVVVYKDGVLDGNIDTLPTEVGTSGVLVLALSADEMNADRVAVKFSDQAGSEWQDLMVTIKTTARHINDLAYPNTTGRGMDVDASGGVEVGSIQSGVITADSISANAIGASEIADGAIDAGAIATDAIDADAIADGAITAGALAAAACNKVADHVIRRTFANAAASSDGDAKAFRSLLGAMAKLVNKVALSGSTLTVYEHDDSTALGTQTTTADSSADPITAVDTD